MADIFTDTLVCAKAALQLWKLLAAHYALSFASRVFIQPVNGDIFKAYCIAPAGTFCAVLF
jgi:hypothetical protein